jgi:hypothetical protein
MSVSQTKGKHEDGSIVGQAMGVEIADYVVSHFVRPLDNGDEGGR